MVETSFLQVKLLIIAVVSWPPFREPKARKKKFRPGDQSYQVRLTISGEASLSILKFEVQILKRIVSDFFAFRCAPAFCFVEVSATVGTDAFAFFSTERLHGDE